ncbi:MAG TPA: hypothetical protein VMF89_35705 [Polyangiales bacterium]|nr:hypothetical protein [Polyangiales bacterium]
MRSIWLWLGLACTSACASSRPAAFVNTCSDYTPRADPNAQRPSIERVRAQAHALFAALDRADERDFTAELGESFALIAGGAVRDRAYLQQGIRDRVARSAPERTRTWQNEQIWVSDAAAVFLGEALIHEPGDVANPGGDYAGWNTVVFARERGSFRAVSWQWVAVGDAHVY